jgi:methylmalonyl-CoA mutase N-terminal domain/subunit
VGVNAFTETDESPIPTLEIHPEIESRQRDNLLSVKAGRDAAGVAAALDAVRAAARQQQNAMPTLIEAARSRATVGEIVAALADVLGRQAGRSVAM